MTQRVEGSVEIESPVSEVYGYWETLENLPYFMKNVEEVRTTGPDSTHWTIKGPFGATVEFDARTTEKEQNSAIGWSTIDGDVGTSGEVRFSELAPRISRVDVVMNYSDPPGGDLGEKASRLLADPQLMLAQDLENLKDILEGVADPGDIQERPAVSNIQIAVFSALSVGLVVVGVAVLAAILRRFGIGGGGSRGSRNSRSAGRGRRRA